MDLSIAGFGTLSLITPLTAKAAICMGLVLDTKPHQWCAGGLIVDSNLIPGILEALAPHCRVRVSEVDAVWERVPAVAGAWVEEMTG